MLAFSLAAGFLLRPLLGMVVNITTLLGEEYTISEFTGEGVNIFRVLVCNVPLVLSYIYRKKLFTNSSETENLMVNLTMLNGAIMFVGLFGTANYFPDFSVAVAPVDVKEDRRQRRENIENFDGSGLSCVFLL